MSAAPVPEDLPGEPSGSQIRPSIAGFDALLLDLTALAAHVCGAPAASLRGPGLDIVWKRADWHHELSARTDVELLTTEALRGIDVLDVSGGVTAAHRSPLAAESSTVPFYAAAPLVRVDGHVLGFLAVYNDVPRILNVEARESLAGLARLAAHQLILRDDSARANALLASAPVAIYHTDPHGHVDYANPEYRRQLGLDPSESLDNWARGVHPDDRARMEAECAEFGRHPRPVVFEYRSTERAGVSRVLAEKVVAAEGLPGFVGTITDITDRVEARASLEALETRFRHTFEQMPVGIAYASRDGVLLRCNAAYAAILGTVPSALEATRTGDLTYGGDRTAPDADIERLWRGDIASYSLERRYLRRDGSPVWVRVTAALIRDANGAPECSVGFLQDISDEKDLEEALGHHQHVLEAVVADVPVAILACDAKGQLLVRNRAAKELFALPAADGVTAADAYALGVEVFQPDGTTKLPREERPLFRALHGETVTDREMTLREGSGPERMTVSSARQLLGPEGTVLGAVVVSQDITARKRSELELDNVHKQLLDASRQAGRAEVATNVLHNVGNVLNSVNVCVSRITERLRRPNADSLARVSGLLREHGNDVAAFVANDSRGRHLPAYLVQFADQLKADQRIALQELAELDGHLDHIKDTVAMQQSYARLCGVTESVAIGSLIDDCLRMNAGALTRHGVIVRREVADVPPITVDKHKVLQILVNLVRNAKYACDESGRSDRLVIVRAEVADRTVRVSVIDNGVGIEPEHRARLFTHGFTTRQSGHGFGLHSAALAALELGGTLTADSPGAGQGATFVLELPTEPPHA